jgi:F0F1-type ATP synthase assembly protein I
MSCDHNGSNEECHNVLFHLWGPVGSIHARFGGWSRFIILCEIHIICLYNQPLFGAMAPILMLLCHVMWSQWVQQKCHNVLFHLWSPVGSIHARFGGWSSFILWEIYLICLYNQPLFGAMAPILMLLGHVMWSQWVQWRMPQCAIPSLEPSWVHPCKILRLVWIHPLGNSHYLS